MSELPKPSPSAAVTVNYATEFCVERLPRKTVGCFVVTVFQVADNKGNTIHVKRGRNYYGKMRHSRHPQACRRLTLYKPPSCDGYLPLNLTVRSHEMQHSALLVGLVSDSPGYDLSHAEGNSLATAMLPLHRIKKSENRALNSASSIKDYIANGGSVSGLKAEVALGNVILDEANTDILTRGSYLWVSDSELRIKRIFTRPLSAVVSIANS